MEERGTRVKLVNCGEFVEYMALVKRQENRRNALGARINTAAQQRFAPWLITVEVGVWCQAVRACVKPPAMNLHPCERMRNENLVVGLLAAALAGLSVPA